MTDIDKDGYVIWFDGFLDACAPEKFNLTYAKSFSTTRSEAENYLFQVNYGFPMDRNHRRDQAALKQLFAEGWYIRPVKLSFVGGEFL